MRRGHAPHPALTPQVDGTTVVAGANRRAAVYPRYSRSLLRQAFRPLTRRSGRVALGVCVFVTGASPAAAGGPQPDAPPTVLAAASPRPELPSRARAVPDRTAPPEAQGRPGVTARGLAARPARVPTSAAGHRTVVATRPRVTAPAHAAPVPTRHARTSPARRVGETAHATWHVPLPLVPTLHPEPPGLAGGTWAYVLVALAAALLVLGGGSLAVTVADVRRDPA